MLPILFRWITPLFWLLQLFILPASYAQGRFPMGIPFTVEEIPYYTFNPLERQVSLRMAYASAVIVNPEVWDNSTNDKQVYEIQLVYTKYPKDFDKWLIDYDWLLENRLKELFTIDPTFQSPDIRWKIVLQTKCEDAETAREMYHGFVVKYKPRKAWVAKYRDGYGKQMEYVRKIIEGDTIPKDTVVLHAFNHRTDWKKMLVIMDWTASMYDYSAQLILWHKENIRRDLIKHVVIFNDGDDNKFKGQKRVKVIGKTGGIYSMDVYNLDNIYYILEKAMRAGNGGDAPENNLEAILKGLRYYSYCEEVVLIADNRAPPRDMSLLRKIKRPVHVILCGTNPEAPDINYLNIASQTGGSIIALNEEIRFEEGFSGERKFSFLGIHYRLSGSVVQKDMNP